MPAVSGRRLTNSYRLTSRSAVQPGHVTYSTVPCGATANEECKPTCVLSIFDSTSSHDSGGGAVPPLPTASGASRGRR